MNKKIPLPAVCVILVVVLGLCGSYYYRFMQIQLHAPGVIEGKTVPPSLAQQAMMQMRAVKAKSSKAVKKPASKKKVAGSSDESTEKAVSG